MSDKNNPNFPQQNINYPLILAIVLFFLCLSCDSQGKREFKPELEEAKKKIELQQKRAIMNTLINRYDPILFPPKNLEGKKIYTYNLRKLLIREDKKPILFIGMLDDITEKYSDFFVHFTRILSKNVLFDKRRITLHLKCRYEDVKSLIENPPNYGWLNLRFSYLLAEDYFFVVSKITDVRKIVSYTVRGSVPEGTEDVELDIETPDVFRAEGELVEMVKAGNAGVRLEIEEMKSHFRKK